jgi:protease-4
LRQTYVDSIGQGRVWAGKDALDLGLVDALGGFEDALHLAAERAGLGTDYRLYELPEQKDPFQQILEGMSAETRTRTMMKKEFGTYYSYLEYLENLAKIKGVQARLPFYFTIE